MVMVAVISVPNAALLPGVECNLVLTGRGTTNKVIAAEKRG